MVSDDYTKLLASINCSISHKENHMKPSELYELIMNLKNKKELKPIERYAIDIIQTEALPQEIELYKNKFNIPQEIIDYVKSYKVVY